MSKKRIFITTIVIMILPVVGFAFFCYIKNAKFIDKDFWVAYMGFFGTVAVSGTALWQNANSEEKEQHRQEQQESQELIRENLNTEHPVLKIKSVKLLSAFGSREVEQYEQSSHQENYFIGKQLIGKLVITVENIGNGLLQNMSHSGLSGFDADKNSKSIAPGESGQLYFFFSEQPEKNIKFNIRYTNIRNFEYEQKLQLIFDYQEYYSFDKDEDGTDILETERLDYVDTSVYIILEKQLPLGLIKSEEEPEIWTD